MTAPSPPPPRPPDAEQEQRLAREVQRAAIDQLLAGGPLAELLHLVLALLVAALIWDLLPVEETIGWIVAVAVAAGLRTWWRLRARRRRPSDQDALAGVRLTVVGIGLRDARRGSRRGGGGDPRLLRTIGRRAHRRAHGGARGRGGAAIRRAAHAFKSSAATLGAKGLAALLDQVETAAMGGDVAQARALGGRFAQESAAVIAYVRSARAGGGG